MDDNNVSKLKRGSIKVNKKKKTHDGAFPDVLPWNGNYNGKDMVNTCTIDNHLYGIHLLLLRRKCMVKTFNESEDPALNTLLQIHNEFKKKNFALGKYLWIAQFPELLRSAQNIDLYGSEEDYFFSRLSCCSTISSSICSNKFCSSPTRPLSSKFVYLRYVYFWLYIFLYCKFNTVFYFQY